MDFEPMSPGFESRAPHDFFLIIYLFYVVVFCHYYYSANSTLLSLLSFSCFITPYDAQASSAFSALIVILSSLQCKIEGRVFSTERSKGIFVRENLK